LPAFASDKGTFAQTFKNVVAQLQKIAPNVELSQKFFAEEVLGMLEKNFLQLPRYNFQLKAQTGQFQALGKYPRSMALSPERFISVLLSLVVHAGTYDTYGSTAASVEMSVTIMGDSEVFNGEGANVAQMQQHLHVLLCPLSESAFVSAVVYKQGTYSATIGVDTSGIMTQAVFMYGLRCSECVPGNTGGIRNFSARELYWGIGIGRI